VRAGLTRNDTEAGKARQRVGNGLGQGAGGILGRGIGAVADRKRQDDDGDDGSARHGSLGDRFVQPRKDHCGRESERRNANGEDGEHRPSVHAGALAHACENRRHHADPPLIDRHSGSVAAHRLRRLARARRRNSRNGALPDILDQRLRRRFRIDAELALEQRHAGIRMRQREFAPAMAGVNPQRRARPVLAERIEGDQPLDSSNRLPPVAARVRELSAFLEHVRSHVFELAARPVEPAVERLAEAEPG
jgi:hypothetical protein